MKTYKQITIGCLFFVLALCIFGVLILSPNNVKAQNEEIGGISYSKYIDYKSGEIEIEDNELICKSLDAGIELSLDELKFYPVKLLDGNVFYIADLANMIQKNVENNIIEGIVSVRIILENTDYPYGDAFCAINNNINKKNNIEILLYNADLKLLTKTYIEFCDENIEMLVIGDWEELGVQSKTAIDFSYNFERNFKSAISSELESVNRISQYSSDIYVNGQRTVKINEFDQYTDSDGLIHDYVNFYREKQHHSSVGSLLVTSDDPIVNIIPKKLFQNVGTYSYIGVEYGFYVHTYLDNGANTYSEYIVFDIETEEKITANKGKVRVVPMFEGVVYYTAHTNLITYNNMGLSTLGASSNLALNNINTKISLTNNNSPNIGDSDYAVEDDRGAYLNGIGLTLQGVGKKNASSNTSMGSVKIVLGTVLDMIPKYGKYIKTAANFLLDAYDIVNEAIDVHYKNAMFETGLTLNGDNQYSFTNFNFLGSTSPESVINKYGAYPRAFDVAFLDQKIGNNQEALLYKTDSDYYELLFGLAQIDDTWESTIHQQITLDIVQDNTKSFGLIKYGSVDYKDTVSGGCVYKYVEKPMAENKITLSESQWEEVAYYYNKGETGIGYQEYVFIPKSSSEYLFDGVGDFNAKITEESSGKTIATITHRTSSQNSYVFNLIKGKRYILKISGINNDAGRCKFFVGRYQKLTLTGENYTNIKMFEYNGDSIWHCFVPDRNEIYTFNTFSYNSSNLNTVLYLYDSKFNLLCFDDDSGDKLYSLINLYCRAGQKYYIQAKNKNQGVNSEFGIMASIQQTVNCAEGMYRHEFYLNSGEVMYYAFMPNISGNYKIYDEKLYGAGTDIAISILDGSLNEIVSDNGGTDSSASITKYLSAGRMYFIQITLKNDTVSGGGCIGVTKV